MKSWKAPILCSIIFCLAAALAGAQTITPIKSTSSLDKTQSLGAPATTAPAAPTNLQALAVATDAVALAWQDNSNNEDGFRVEFRTGSGSYTEVNGLVPSNADRTAAVFLGQLTPGTTYFFRVRATNNIGNSAYSNETSVTTLTSDTPCVANATTMCLNNNRFRVQALFLTGAGQGGEAKTVKLTDDSGYLWFFSASNIEAVVKVLNGCGVNNRYWVFAGGLTDVRVVLTVTDTQTTAPPAGYVNPLGAAFLPIQDTSALDSCP
jgi:hypothetical protein